MERDYSYPSLADRDGPRSWAEKGGHDAWTRARERARQVLADHNPTYLTLDQDTEIHARFNIL